MKQTLFKTNPVHLEELLRHCGAGKIQLPDFQRGWVWDEERIKSLIASISQAFPVGALMTLEMKPGIAETFARRPVEGAEPAAESRMPEQLLLDGQQRMTSLYQTCIKRDVVETITPRLKQVKRWFYIKIEAALDARIDREEAIITVPEDRQIKSDFARSIDLDVSTPDLEYENMMFPVNQIFDWDDWQDGFVDYWANKGDAARRQVFKRFKDEVLQNFKAYQVPVIALGSDTSHAAVCLVFEKVNTGGKPLDAFELVTAMYAAQGHRLRDDWLGTKNEQGMQRRLQAFGHTAGRKVGALEKVASTDVLQAISLLHTAQIRRAEMADGRKESDLTGVKATRAALLDLPLSAYLTYRDVAEEGFKTAAKLLHRLHIFQVRDLPYQSQLVPLAAILATIGDKWDNATVREKLTRWYWCGIFGELYGSAIESRFARDIIEVPDWIDGGPVPTTVRDGVFRADRLRTMRSRQSAAYKGIQALLMAEGAIDFRSGQPFSQTAFFDEWVDIHHIFPKAWCEKNKIEPKVYDTIINKTPLGYRTNRILGGDAPSRYLGRLEAGTKDSAPISPGALNRYLSSHAIDCDLLRADQFNAFMADRERRLLELISLATGHSVVRPIVEDLDEELVDESLDLTDEEAA